MFEFRIIDAYNYSSCYLEYLFRILIYSYGPSGLNEYDHFSRLRVYDPT